jgi:S1-C subfamily serine protease
MRPGQTVQVEVARKGGTRKTYPVKLIALNVPELAQGPSAQPDEEAAPEAGAVIAPLGITVQKISPDDAAQMGLPRGTGGLVVLDVTPDGPSWGVLSAASAGGPPEVILSVEGKAVSDEADLRAALAKPGPGGIVTLDIMRPLQSGNQRRIERIKLAQ